MRKLFIVVTAVVFVCAFTLPALAQERLEDRVKCLEQEIKRLQLSGAMRVEAWSKDNFSDYDSDNDGDEQTYWDQRFRLGGCINVAEGLSGHFRVDLAEQRWGMDFDGTRFRDASELQVDRAYLQIKQKMYDLKAGLIYQGLGNKIAVDQNKTGFTLDLKLPVKLTLMYAKWDENDSLTDQDATDDQDFYAANAGFKAGPLALNAFIAMLDEKAAEDSRNVIGVQGKGALGKVALNLELNLFGGSNDTTEVDYMGTQFYGNAEIAISEPLKVGADFFYAAGTDADDEQQLTFISDWGSFALDDRGALNTFVNAYDEFDPSGESGGSTGFGLYADYAVMKSLLLQAAVAYFTPQEEVSWDSVTSLNVSAKYKFLPNTSVKLHYNNTAPDAEDADSATAMIAFLQMDF
jgi:hypothetical protein